VGQVRIRRKSIGGFSDAEYRLREGLKYVFNGCRGENTRLYRQTTRTPHQSISRRRACGGALMGSKATSEFRVWCVLPVIGTRTAVRTGQAQE